MTAEARILEAAERRIRISGYNGFSFRDIARDTGLTNAGVHHHFRTKSDLVARVAETYAARFLSALDDAPVGARARRLEELFDRAANDDGQMCLCGLLAAERGALPDSVIAATQTFFAGIVERLTPTFAEHHDPEGAATALLARLEGALLMGHITSDPCVFRKAMTRA